jgi:DNA invertase Pin-like site-specific DNA recombinase
MTKRAVLYSRISTGDQHLETQLLDLRELAKQRGLEIVREYSDVISGTKSKRPGLDSLMSDARRRRFDVVLVAAFDRIARNVRHFLEVLDELSHLNIQFISLRENIDTGGPLGRALLTIIGAISELERSLIVERVKAGMRRAKLEGRTDWANAAEHQQGTSCQRPAFWNVAYAGCEEAQDFTSVGLPSGEGIGRKRNRRDCSGKRGVIFQTLLGVSGFSFLECFTLTEKALSRFEVGIRPPAVAAVSSM